MRADQGGGVKGCTYVLTLGIAHNPPNSKDVPPHSMILKLFTRRGLVGHFTFPILHFTNVNFQRCTSQRDTQAVHTKGISKIEP